MFQNFIHVENIGFVVKLKDFDIVIKFNPGKNIGVMFVRCQEDIRLLFVRFFDSFKHFDSFLDCSSRSTACGKGHIKIRIGAERFEEALLRVVHHFSGVF